MLARARRVSVIIPCHNHAAYLGDCLTSVTAQTWPPDEVIVVDDGSTDDSAAVALASATNIMLVRQPRGGAAAARNAGLRSASGDVIAFLDADDLWPIDSLNARMRRLDSEPTCAAVYGMVEQFFSPELDPITRARFEIPLGERPGRISGSLLVERTVFDRIGLFDPEVTMGETMDWVARLAADGAPVAEIDALVLRRRIHGRNTVLNHSHADYLQVLRKALHRKAVLQASGACPE